MDLRTLKYRYRKQFKEFSFRQIECAYLSLCEVLNEKFKPERTRTSFEQELYHQIRLRTSLQVYRSFWIGSRNIDLFIPGVRDESFIGMVIEVDGKIHDKEFKMKKDIAKLDMLASLSIIVISVDNHDIKHPRVLDILDSLPKMQKPDSRARKRLLRNIYIKTLIAHKEILIEKQLSLPASVLSSLGMV